MLFSDNITVIHDRVRIEKIKPMIESDYQVGGCTSFLDAIGGAIHHIGTIHKYARDEDKLQSSYGSSRTWNDQHKLYNRQPEPFIINLRLNVQLR